jgi:hypothetical protein
MPTSPTSSPSSSLSGVWTGTIQTGAWIGNARMTISQAASSLQGTWSVTYPGNLAMNDSGFVSGQAIALNVTLDLTSSVPGACPYRATATLAGASFMTGSYTTVRCSATLSGLFSLTKQQ